MKEDLVAAVSNMKEQEALNLVQEMLDNGEDPQNILDACNEAMSIVGINYEQGIYFLPELIMSGEILKQITDLIKPKMAAGSAGEKAVLGTVVLGTVKDDIHDIGKDIVGFMLEVNGFKVHDLGIDVPEEKFVDKVREVNPDIVALSGFLTSVFEQMKKTVEALEQAKLRDRARVMIGGCQMSQDVVKFVGADGYRPDAVSAVNLAKEWVGGK